MGDDGSVHMDVTVRSGNAEAMGEQITVAHKNEKKYTEDFHAINLFI